MTSETRSTVAELNFAPSDGPPIVFNAADRGRSDMVLEQHSVVIGDVRSCEHAPSLDSKGFELLTRPSALANPRDAEKVERIYLPEIQDAVRDLTGAIKVVCFGTVVRSDDGASADSSRPASFAHVDFDGRTVRRFATELLGDSEASYWLGHRHIQMNFWRPLRTVERMPLALADASTISADDLVLMETYGGLNDPDRPVMYGYALMLV